MVDRRTFLQSLSVVAVAASIPVRLLGDEEHKPSIGLQMYTVRRQLGKDFEGTLRKVKALGIRDVEFENYFGKEPGAVRKILDSTGLASSSAHISTATLRDELEKACEAALILGQKYLIVGWLPPDERKSLDDYKRLIEHLNRGSEICRKAGIELGYHNHDFEFTELDGKIPYHMILTQTGDLTLELDVYWATKAGRDPLNMLKAHPGRFRLFHLKDMAAETRDFTEVGSGVIDFKAILAQASASGVERCFVEQDETPGDPFASVNKSLVYLRSIGY